MALRTAWGLSSTEVVSDTSIGALLPLLLLSLIAPSSSASFTVYDPLSAALYRGVQAEPERERLIKLALFFFMYGYVVDA